MTVTTLALLLVGASNIAVLIELVRLRSRADALEQLVVRLVAASLRENFVGNTSE